jgi:DNA primase
VLGDGEPKYLNTSETPVFSKSRNLYAIDRAKNEIVKAGQAVVVEGYTDVIALHEAGVSNAVATLGTALTRQHVKMLGRFASRIVYLFDADEAGQRAAERAVEFIDVSVAPAPGASAVELAVATIPEAKDPADYVAAQGADAMRTVIGEAVPLMEFVLGRRMAAHDTTTPEGRARALADAASILATVRGTLLAQDYTNYVADRLLTDFATVESAVNRARPAFARSADDADTAGVAATSESAITEQIRMSPQVRAERDIIGLVAAFPRLRGKARDLLASGLLTDMIAVRLLEVVLESGEATGAALYAFVRDAAPETAEVLTGTLVGAEDVSEPEFVAAQTETRLKEFAVERQIIEKKAHMRSLDPLKDRDGYDELFREIAALQVRHEKLRSGEVDHDDREVWG